MKIRCLPVLLILALINSCIELEVSAPGFPDIMQYFQVSATTVGLTITYNLAGFCMTALFYGPLSERYGRRPIMIVGNGILAIGAIGCVFAPTMGWLLTSRFFQGIGAATSAVVVSAIIADVYPAARAAYLYGIMNAIFTLLIALSPIVGGVINLKWGWRANYAVVALIASISWLLLILYLPETQLNRAKSKLCKLIAGYRLVLSHLTFLSAAIIPSLLYACYMTFVAIAPFIYRHFFDMDMRHYTYHQGAIILVSAITSAFSGQITRCVGAKKTILLGAGLALLGTASMLIAFNPLALTATMSLFCMGLALLYPIIFAYSMDIFPAMKGIASSVIMSLRYLLCCVITGIGSYFYQGQPLHLSIVLFLVVLVISMLVKNLRVELGEIRVQDQS
jgi:DHA1 family bicyclomycin/chloramphenicol resistance-like MFS transporter